MISTVLRIPPTNVLPAASPAPVAVLLISFDTTQQTLRCLDSLRSQTHPPSWIGILDNAPQRGELLEALSKCPALDVSEVALYQSSVNLGFAAGTNALIAEYLQHEACDHIILLNNDAVASSNLVELFVDAINQNPGAGMVGGRMHKLHRPDQIDTLGISIYSSLLPADRQDLADPYLGPTGGCALISRQCLESAERAVGYVFDERFFCYCEDTDLALRVNLLGYRPAYIDELVALHEGQASAGGAGSEFIAYHGLRNLIWMVVKNTPGSLALRYGALFLFANFLSVIQQFMLFRFRLVWRIYRDAFQGMSGILADRRQLKKSVLASNKVIGDLISARFYRRGYFYQAIKRLFGLNVAGVSKQTEAR